MGQKNNKKTGIYPDLTYGYEIVFDKYFEIKKEVVGDKRCILIPYVGSNLGEVGIFPNKYRCHLASNIAKVELNSNN